MNRHGFPTTVCTSFALTVVLATAWPMQAQNAKSAFSSMAPVDQYLMERSAEIALARSAAPESIAKDAEVLVLGPKGYEIAVKGQNVFVCIVERSWTSAPVLTFGIRKCGPRCVLMRQARVPTFHAALKGPTWPWRDVRKPRRTISSQPQSTKKELPAMEPGAMCYMMSKQGYGGDSVEHWHPHLMFYNLRIEPATLGANLPNSPIQSSNATREHFTTIVFLVRHWSDGTQDR